MHLSSQSQARVGAQARCTRLEGKRCLAPILYPIAANPRAGDAMHHGAAPVVEGEVQTQQDTDTAPVRRRGPPSSVLERIQRQ